MSRWRKGRGGPGGRSLMPDRAILATPCAGAYFSPPLLLKLDRGSMPKSASPRIKGSLRSERCRSDSYRRPGRATEIRAGRRGRPDTRCRQGSGGPGPQGSGGPSSFSSSTARDEAAHRTPATCSITFATPTSADPQQELREGDCGRAPSCSGALRRFGQGLRPILHLVMRCSTARLCSRRASYLQPHRSA